MLPGPTGTKPLKHYSSIVAALVSVILVIAALCTDQLFQSKETTINPVLMGVTMTIPISIPGMKCGWKTLTMGSLGSTDYDPNIHGKAITAGKLWLSFSIVGLFLAVIASYCDISGIKNKRKFALIFYCLAAVSAILAGALCFTGETTGLPCRQDGGVGASPILSFVAGFIYVFAFVSVLKFKE